MINESDPVAERRAGLRERLEQILKVERNASEGQVLGVYVSVTTMEAVIEELRQLEAANDLEASSEAPQAENELEMKYRSLLWLGHGHQGLYGDDGEMQCSQCAPVWDYKRAPLEQVEAVANIAKMERVARALHASPTVDLEASSEPVKDQAAKPHRTDCVCTWCCHARLSRVEASSEQEKQKADRLLGSPAPGIQDGPPSTSRRPLSWQVSVDRDGENLVTIGSSHLSGKPDFTDDEAQLIRDAAEHLLSFIGNGETSCTCWLGDTENSECWQWHGRCGGEMTEIGLELRAAALSLLGGAGADEKASRAIADVLERAADKIEDLHQTIAHARINTGRAYQRLGGVIGGKIMTEQKRGER